MATEDQAGVEAPSQDEERRPTERVILQRVDILRIPVDATQEQVQGAIAALYPKARKAEIAAAGGEAWIEVGRHVGATKRAAIVAHTGEPGTPTAKVGEFRAPSVTAWKGGLKLTAPPKPLIEAEVID